MLELNAHKHKELEFIEKEKYLDVVFANNLKFSSDIINQINKANRSMGLTRRSYTYLDKNFFRYLFNALVRPSNALVIRQGIFKSKLNYLFKIHTKFKKFKKFKTFDLYLTLTEWFKTGGGFRNLPGVFDVDFCENG